MKNWHNTLSEFIANDLIVIVFAMGIIFATWIIYVIVFRPKLNALDKALNELIRQLKQAQGNWPTLSEAGNTTAEKNDLLHAPWRDTKARVMMLPHGKTYIPVMFGPVNDLWTPNRLLRKRMNVAVFEAMPNLLVGVGLLFTFIFLSLALSEATVALTGASQDQTQIMQATRDLLSTAGAKFTTSLAGLLASIVWTVHSKNRMATLARAGDEIAELIQSAVSISGTEMSIYGQLQTLHKIDSTAQTQQTLLHELLNESKERKDTFGRFETTIADAIGDSITKALAPHIESMTEKLSSAINDASEKVDITNQQLQTLDTTAQAQQELLTELLEESKEQTGALKRFETDLAITLGNTITNAFTPQMESMTTRLVSTIDGLSEKLGTMNQDALSKMIEDFAGMIKDSTAAEMDAFRESLGKLADRLDTASILLTQGATESGKVLDDASKNLAENVANAAASLLNGATSLDTALLSAKTTVNDLNQTIAHAAELGRSGSKRFGENLQETIEVIEKLRLAGTGWQEAVTLLSKTSGELTEVINSIEELAQEQKGVIRAVKEATPNALETIGSISEILKTSALQAEKSMHEARDAMERTGQTLGGTVTAITQGVSEYSNQLASLHVAMDSQLSKAIGQIGGSVASLEDAIEELGEVLETKFPKG